MNSLLGFGTMPAMGFNCGIVGLPNVGKSTLFNAMTAAHVPAEKYPFCTKDHHTGIVALPDPRLTNIASIFKPERVVPAHVEFVDIAGLVEGAHKGEGLGNRFLGHIREVDAIAHVVRCFDAPDVAHAYEKLDPVHDIEVVNTELLLADLEIVAKQHDKISHVAKSGDAHAKKQLASMEKLKAVLEAGFPAQKADLTNAEWEELPFMGLITDKPVLYVLNVNETDVREPSQIVRTAIDYTQNQGAPAIEICGSIEDELADLEEKDRKEFLKDLGLEEAGLPRLIHAAFRLLDMITFFTKDGPEVRAWNIKRGTRAPQAAGKIHTDFEKGFMRAEVYSYDELMKAGSEHKIREQGHIRIEGHLYEIKDGDIVHFRFNV
ncbi:MAG: redox-regulated ATPase YchF [Pseudomonadota bacterium]